MSTDSGQSDDFIVSQTSRTAENNIIVSIKRKTSLSVRSESFNDSAAGENIKTMCVSSIGETYKQTYVSHKSVTIITLSSKTYLISIC